MPEHQQIQQSKKTNTIFQKQAAPVVQTPASNPYSIIQRAKINPKSLTHADIMQLQRTIGNRAVGRLLSGIGNTSTAQQVAVQRQEIPEEEEPLQGKMIQTIQRQEIPEEEEPLQGKFENKPETVCPSCFAAPLVQKQEIPEEEEPLQGKMIGTIQRQEIPEEEEPLQGKFETIQLQEIPEEEEPLQGKMAESLQLQEIPEEEEPLQGKFTKTIQRQEIPKEEEPLQGKMIQTIQRQEIPEEDEPLQGKMIENVQRQEIPEEEEPLQGKFENKPEIVCPSCFAVPIVQKQEIPEDEEPLQSKMIETVQRQEIPEDEEPLQTKRENNTGMPDNLKAGVENLSGIDMSDVRVHYNSDIPSQLQAHAYAQGTDIHLAPGQEKHLSHEAWHVVQQKQGRVKPTMQAEGKVNINDDARLEKEADMMGQKAIQFYAIEPQSLKESPLSSSSSSQQQVAQLRHIGLFGFEAEVVGERFKINAMNFSKDEVEMMGGQDTTYPIINDPDVVLEGSSLGKLSNYIKITLDNEVTFTDNSICEKSYTVEFVQDPVDVLGDESNINAVASDWGKVAEFWKYLYGNKDPEKTFYELMEARKEIILNKHLEGEQLSKYEGNGNIDIENTEKCKKYSLNWEKTANYISVKTENPKVSPQLTAGASLLALDKAFLATHLRLFDREKNFSKEDAEKLNIKHPKTEKEVALRETIALVTIIKRYLQATRPKPSEDKRYMKEYIPLMTRNSMDAIYGSMSQEGQKYFRNIVIKYLNKVPNNYLLQKLELEPDAKFFEHTAIKEPGAEGISIEQVLLSILKIKRGEASNTFVKDEEAKHGDAFSQAHLDGISEINPDDLEMQRKFGISAPDEMMNGVKGIIFENRLAKVAPLSEMKELFISSANALKLVQDTFDAREREDRVQEDAPKARNMKNVINIDR